MAAAIEYSDNYLYWDNVESLSVLLEQTDDAIKTAAAVPCGRVGPTGIAAPNFSGADLETETVVWRVPAALLFESAAPATIYRLHIGDRLTDGTTTWRVQSIQEARSGSSLSHYVATTIPER